MGLVHFHTQFLFWEWSNEELNHVLMVVALPVSNFPPNPHSPTLQTDESAVQLGPDERKNGHVRLQSLHRNRLELQPTRRRDLAGRARMSESIECARSTPSCRRQRRSSYHGGLDARCGANPEIGQRAISRRQFLDLYRPTSPGSLSHGTSSYPGRGNGVGIVLQCPRVFHVWHQNQYERNGCETHGDLGQYGHESHPASVSSEFEPHGLCLAASVTKNQAKNRQVPRRPKRDPKFLV